MHGVRLQTNDVPRLMSNYVWARSGNYLEEVDAHARLRQVRGECETKVSEKRGNRNE